MAALVIVYDELQMDSDAGFSVIISLDVRADFDTTDHETVLNRFEVRLVFFLLI